MDTPATRAREQLAGCLVLGLGGIGDQDIDTESMAIVHQHVPVVAQPGSLAIALAHEPGVRIGGTPVRRIRSFLVFEVDHPGPIPPPSSVAHPPCA